MSTTPILGGGRLLQVQYTARSCLRSCARRTSDSLTAPSGGRLNQKGIPAQYVLDTRSIAPRSVAPRARERQRAPVRAARARVDGVASIAAIVRSRHDGRIAGRILVDGLCELMDGFPFWHEPPRCSPRPLI